MKPDKADSDQPERYKFYDCDAEHYIELYRLYLPNYGRLINIGDCLFTIEVAKQIHEALGKLINNGRVTEA